MWLQVTPKSLMILSSSIWHSQRDGSASLIPFRRTSATATESIPEHPVRGWILYEA